MQKSTDKGNFAQGSILGHIIKMAVPLVISQLVNVLYNIVDRVFIGHIPNCSDFALGGLGVAMPIISMITAFGNLCTIGGTPHFSIASGRGDTERARRIIGNTFSLCILFTVAITIIGYAFMDKIIFLFGAGEQSFAYAKEYLQIYLLGNFFVLVSIGMCGFITARGMPKKAMLAVAIGAIVNIILDPIFIFTFDMGIKGAAVATVIAQGCSAVWVMRLCCDRNPDTSITLESIKPDAGIMKDIITLGFSGFVMRITNSAVQGVANNLLLEYGGELYLSAMTVICSIREMVIMVAHAICDGVKPILGYNYGAHRYDRVKESIKTSFILLGIYNLLISIVIFLFTDKLIMIFNESGSLMEIGVRATRIYFCCYFFMTLQSGSQAVFTGLGKSRQAVFFSIFRKIVLVVAISLLFTKVMGMGTDGVFLAEPVSEVIGGLAAFITMIVVMNREYKEAQ